MSRNRLLLDLALVALPFACVAAELETSKWQAAIDAAAKRGGGTVVVPKGRHVVGQLYLKSNVELHLDEGATLEGAVGLHNYVAHTLPFSEGTWSAVVMGLGVTNVAITGKGEIFGNGAKFEPVKANGGCAEGFRPRGVFFSACRGIRLEDFTLRDAACWGIVLKCCDGMAARRVKVNSVANLNNDGFDIEAKNVLIEDCDVDSGDDAYCIKSNNPDFTVENVTVRNCIARSHCNGYKLGTATHGTMRGIRVEHCRAAASRRVYRDLAPMPANLVRWPRVKGAPYYLCGPGISAICVECVDGGVVEDVTFDDIEVSGFQVPVFVRGGTRKGRACGTPPSDWHVLRNVTISNVRGRAEQMLASSVTGVKGCRPADVVLANFDLECVGEGETVEPIREPGPEMAGKYPEATMFRGLRLPCYGLYVDQADGVSTSNLAFRLRAGTSDARPAVFFSKDSSRRLASPAGEPQLRMGVLSDIHLTCRPKADETFLKALRHFRDRGADAVMIAGDIANSGRVAELKMCADAWYSVFPDDRAPDGRKVERLFVLGNHCVEAWKWGRGYTSPIKDEQARLADSIGYADNRRKAWRDLFHEDFEPIWMKSVRGFTVIGAHWEKAGEGIGIEAFMKAHAKDIDPTKPFFYVQHEHPKDTCFGPWAWGHDDGRSTRALSAFPNAIAFSGHSHYSLTDERTVWQGAFTSCNTASLFNFSMDYALRENAPGNRFGYTGDKGRPRRMKNMQSCEARQGQFLTVFSDRIVIERRDFMSDRSLGDDFVLPLPLGREKPCAYLPRGAVRAAPEFPEGATVEVAVRGNAATDTVYEISFPHAETRRNCRVFEYEVTATLMADGVDLVQLQRRVIAPDFHLADIAACHRRGVCLIASADLPLKGDYVFSVRPIECFGHKGAAVASAVTKVTGERR